MFASKDLFFTRPSGYQISRSVRTRSSASAYFNRTPAGAGNRQKFTISMWIKRGVSASAGQWLMAASTGTANQDCYLCFGGSVSTGGTQDTLAFFSPPAGNSISLITNALYRDFSAWYHVVCAVDTTQATAANRILLYVNGVQITSFSTATYPTLNQNLNFNNTTSHTIASATVTPSNFFDGYLTEINFIDGQALTPSSFGSTNTTTGVWQPAKYTGAYGTNGFYLNFSDNSAATATTIGKDYSGNGNNWTPNNISVTAGVTYDSMIDVPTSYGDGGNGRGNYAVLNPLYTNGFNPLTLTNGNLTATSSSGARIILSTLYQNTGAYYFEATCTTVGTLTGSRIGIRNDTVQRYYDNSGNYFDGSSSAAYGATYTTGDVLGVAFDLTNQTITFYKNGTSQGQKTAIGLTGQDVTPFVYADTSGVWNANFGQRPFSYTPPSGYSALNTLNLPTPTISNGATVMAATLYTGNGGTQSITNTVNGISFQPDFVWVKARSLAYSNYLYDSVRGTGTSKSLISDATAAEGAGSANANLTSFDSSGFSLGTTSGTNGMNANAGTFVGWQWKAGGTSSSNTNGSITSNVSVGATQGFSVVTYTGTGANATVGHGLGVAPSMVIVKQRTAASTTNWQVRHTSITAANSIQLNLTNAAAAAATVWNSTAPTSTVFSIGTDTSVNVNTGTYVAYCFSAVAGYSAFGSYTGNGSTDGPFVFTNFQPRWVMVKRTDSTSDWYIWDTSRDTYNVESATLLADTSGAETSAASIDGLSNGFKCRSATVVNASGGTYIYAAFASSPFKLSLAR